MITAEIETKTIPPTERRTMDASERMEQLRQKELYFQASSADYRDDFEAGWDAGRQFAERKGSNVQS